MNASGLCVRIKNLPKTQSAPPPPSMMHDPHRSVNIIHHYVFRVIIIHKQ